MEENTNMKNRRISPQGIINLPFVVRKALGFRKGEQQLLTVIVASGGVQISSESEAGPNTCKASPHGLMQLPPEAREVLLQKGSTRYGIQIAGDADSYDATRQGERAAAVHLFAA